MAALDTVMRVVHLLAGGLLAGSVVYVAWVLRDADGESALGREAVETLAGTLTSLSRVCAVLLLVSGGYMAAVLGSALRGTPGMLVGIMILLWLIVTMLVEVGNSKLAGGASVSEIQQYYGVAAVAAILLLIDAGYLGVI